MIRIADVTGLWRRSLIAWPDGSSDTTTRVRWLQGLRMYADLRQPASKPDFSHVKALEDLTLADCTWLATQKGFAGRLGFDGRYFEWAREIDFQPPSSSADAGSLEWQGDVLLERGRDVDYIEHWHRDVNLVPEPCGALFLRAAGLATNALLLRVGAIFMFARDRATPLPAGQTLGDCLAGTTLESARALIDCEISFGSVTRDGFRISDSTLPHRVGRMLDHRIVHDTVTTREPARVWHIIDREGDVDGI